MAQLLTVRAVAAQLAVSRSSVYKMLEGGLFPPAPVRLPNGSPRWPQELVDDWVEAHRCDGEGSGHCRVLGAGETERWQGSRPSGT